MSKYQKSDTDVLVFAHFSNLVRRETSGIILASPLGGVDPTGDRSHPHWNHPPPEEILVQSCLQ